MRRALVFYTERLRHWTSLRAGTLKLAAKRASKCPRYLLHVRQRKAIKARATYSKWSQFYTLRDYEVRDGNHAWERSVTEVQKVFPGTDSWLLSCSDSEGGHGRWVSYAARYTASYAADHYIVGGWMQFKYPTFTGMYRRALEHLRVRRFRVPRDIRRPSLTSWQSPLAQALAAGWARYVGEDGSHWSASWNTGCR